MPSPDARHALAAALDPDSRPLVLWGGAPARTIQLGSAADTLRELKRNLRPARSTR